MLDDNGVPKWANSASFRFVTYLLVTVQVILMVICSIFVLWLSSKIDCYL
jgi:hypothetical protein